MIMIFSNIYEEKSIWLHSKDSKDPKIDKFKLFDIILFRSCCMLERTLKVLGFKDTK